MKKLLISLLALGHVMAMQAMDPQLYLELEAMHQAFTKSESDYSQIDRRIVPFEKAKHGDSATALYRVCFDDPQKSDAENRRQIPSILTGKSTSTTAKILLDPNDALIGFIIYRDYIKQITNSTADEEVAPTLLKIRVIDHLGVDSSYRNQNNGSYLMQEIEKLAYKDGIDRITLNASLKARTFYERLAFTAQLIGPKYIQMQKTLTPTNEECS